jgi:hypothetical protein
MAKLSFGWRKTTVEWTNLRWWWWWWSLIPYFRVSQPGFRGTLRFREMSLGVPREILIEKKNKQRFLNLLAKINRSTEKYYSLLKWALTIIIGLLYLQLTDHADVPWAVDIIIFIQEFPETWKLFQGFLRGKKIEKGCYIWIRKLIIGILKSD